MKLFDEDGSDGPRITNIIIKRAFTKNRRFPARRRPKHSAGDPAMNDGAAHPQSKKGMKRWCAACKAA